MDKIAKQIKALQLFGMVGGVSLSLRKNEVGIFCGIPIFEYALNLAVFLIITIFAFVKESYLCNQRCVHAVYIQVYKVKYIIVL